ncbi:MAG: hypothetical protein HYR67_15560 [Bacteroidetes bacterium]|nr:hypothetical protein [Bacteroidota bacterium]
MDAETSVDWTSKVIPLGATGIISLLIGVLLEKFKNRLCLLKYSTSFQSIATSSQVDNWGAIDVYHNGRLTKHLNFVSIKIENSSNADLQDVNIDVSCDPQSQFLAHSAFYNESNRPILLEQNHYNYYTEVLQRNQADMVLAGQNPNHVTPKQLSDELLWVQVNKKFHLPVFYRKTEITINLLAENYQAYIPTIGVGVLHKSVKLLMTTDVDADNKKIILWMLGLGVLILSLELYLLIDFFPLSKEPIIIATILALTCSLVGLGVVMLFRFIRRIVM